MGVLVQQNQTGTMNLIEVPSNCSSYITAAFFPKQFTVRGSQFFLTMCLPFVSLLVSALFRWPCSISIHLSPRSVTVAFYSFLSQVCRCWCPPLSVGRVACLFICFPGLSLLVSALFRWRCNISIHLSPRSVTGVRPFPQAM